MKDLNGIENADDQHNSFGFPANRFTEIPACRSHNPEEHRWPSSNDFDNFLDVMGKMADNVSNQLEMLRDERILNRMLRNTIEVLKDGNNDKAARIKELERTVEIMKNQSLESTAPKPSDQRSHECNRQFETIQKPPEDPDIKTHAEVSLSLEEQWNVCTVERRQRYEQFQMGQKAVEQQSKNENNAKKKKKQHNSKHKGNNGKVQNESEKSSHESQRKEFSKTEHTAKSHTSNSDTSSEETNKKSTHKWRTGTVLITGDSMLNGIEEAKLQTRHNVKVRPFSGATTEDIRSYLLPLLKKEPATVILHIGTNDATENGMDSDILISRILDLKAEIEKTVNGCKVILSLPMRRKDNNKANKILMEVCEKIIALKLDIINNSNIMIDQLGRRGLHLNQHGNARFAQNLLNKLQCV